MLENLSEKEFKEITKKLKEEKIIKHIAEASSDELKRYKELMQKYRVTAWDIGSAVGKQYLGESDSSTELAAKLNGTINAAHALGTKRIRIFNFYPGTKEQLANPGTESFNEYRTGALKYIKEIGKRFQDEGLFGFLEVETNLIGRDGKSLVEFLDEAKVGNIFLYFDGANMVVQDTNKEGLSWKTYSEMANSPYLGGLHIKDAKYSEANEKKVDEEAHWPFVPVGKGNADYDLVFANLADKSAEKIKDIEKRLLNAGLLKEFGLVLEPHLLCGGQFGGYTGGRYQEAIDALVELLTKAGIRYAQSEGQLNFG